MRKIDLIVVHCSATRCDRRFSVEDLIACHDARFGFTGYHYYITRQGQVYQTRHEQLVGAHAVGYNQHSVGVCYEGGLTPEGRPADTRTREQKAALHALSTNVPMPMLNCKTRFLNTVSQLENNI